MSISGPFPEILAVKVKSCRNRGEFLTFLAFADFNGAVPP